MLSGCRAIASTRPQMTTFMEEARVALRRPRANLICGTVRLTEKDDETRDVCLNSNQGVDH